MLTEWFAKDGGLYLMASVGNRSICLQESIYGRAHKSDVPTIFVARQYRNKEKAVIDNIPESVMRNASQIKIGFEKQERLYRCSNHR